MKVSSSRLPLFRSPEQERVLSQLFVFADEPISLSELAKRAGISVGGAHKEVQRLESAGLVRSTFHGRSRLVEADPTSPFHPELRGLLLKSRGPEPMLRAALGGLEGIEQAFIYGSWADPSKANPADIDVLIIGDPDIGEIYDAASALEPDPASAATWLEDANRHLDAATRIADVDRSGAYVLAYDAARKSVAAALLTTGHRVLSRPGSHQALARFASSLSGETGDRALARFDRLRRERNRSEYGSRTFSGAEVQEAIVTARAIRVACESLI